jgi:hypothetical protein
VSITPPDLQTGLQLPTKGEPLELVDIAQVNDSARVQKALRRLASEKAPTSLAQLVMWRVSAGLDWDTIARMSAKWANGYELTLAKDFVKRLDALAEGETGRLIFEIEAREAATQSFALEVKEAIRHKFVLGLVAEVGIPAHPDGPAVTCRVDLTPSQAFVQVATSDSVARKWVPCGKFTLPLVQESGNSKTTRFVAVLSEGILERLVRAHLSKGVKDKGKMHYQIRIDNASPWILNGLAAVGTASEDDETPRVLSGICVSPRRSLTVPASEEVVKALGLKKGIKLVALNLSGL